jgi:hypothetical protein
MRTQKAQGPDPHRDFFSGWQLPAVPLFQHGKIHREKYWYPTFGRKIFRHNIF